MSCDTSIYHTTVDLDPCLSPRLDLDDYATASETGLERDKAAKQGRFGLTADQSKSKGHRHEVQSGIIPDSTQTGLGRRRADQ
jgi:hypothetical protein